MIITTPIGKLGLKLSSNILSSIRFLPKTALLSTNQDQAIQRIITELHAYFKNPQHQFKLEFQMEGTAFQKRVWKALQNIPSGKVLTYKELAQKLKTSPRAIGNACRRNPLPIIVPCHRVVSQQGLGGYNGKTGGEMLNIKQWLLKHEGSI